MHQKMVENYQFEESRGFLQDGIDTYLAKHTLQKKYYFLKKVNTKEQTDRKKYQLLINEVGILKTVSHSCLSECHKMLKTPNNIYLVYDYWEGQKLQDVLKSKKTTSDKYKFTLTNNIIAVLRKMKECNVVHCNFHPKSILVDESGQMKLFNFLYAHNLDGASEISAKFQPPVSQYLAPQIKNTKIVNIKSDLYSVGLILNELFKNESKNKYSDLFQITKQMISIKPNDRPDIEKLQQALIAIKEEGGVSRQRKKSADLLAISPQLGKIKKPKSLNDNESKSNVSIKSNSDIELSERNYVELVLKRRNMALFLLQISENCLSIEWNENSLGLFLGIALLKMSTRVITGVLGFVKSDPAYSNQIVNNLSEGDKRIFEKKKDYLNLISVLNKESTSQKRWLEEVIKAAKGELTKEEQTKVSKDIPDSEIKVCAIKFLQMLLTNQDKLSQLSSHQLIHLYLMSEIIQYHSYDKMFEDLIADDKINLEDQYLYIHAKRMSREQIIETLRERSNCRN